MTPRWSPNPHSLLSRQTLLAEGVHPRRLASGEFTEVIPGFCTPTEAPAGLHLIARVLQREAGPGTVSSAGHSPAIAPPLPAIASDDERHCAPGFHSWKWGAQWRQHLPGTGGGGRPTG